MGSATGRSQGRRWRQALRLISVVIIVFHASTAVVEAYAFFRGGVSAEIWLNVLVRTLVFGLFAYYGLRRR